MKNTIGRHLASFNLFRESDGSLAVTIAEARGVAEELNGSGAPLALCAMAALRAALNGKHHAPVQEAGEEPIDWSAPLIDSNGKAVRITMTPDQQPDAAWAGHYDVRVGKTGEHRTVRADTGFTPDGDYHVKNVTNHAAMRGNSNGER